MSTKRAAIYCRISDDKRGDGAGVNRQRADCQALAERAGYAAVGVYVDNDISAFSGKVRPRYAEMCQAVKDGEVD